MNYRYLNPIVVETVSVFFFEITHCECFHIHKEEVSMLKEDVSQDKMNSNCCFSRLSLSPRRFMILSLGYAEYIWYTKSACCDAAELLQGKMYKIKENMQVLCCCGFLMKSSLNPNTFLFFFPPFGSTRYLIIKRSRTPIELTALADAPSVCLFLIKRHRKHKTQAYNSTNTHYFNKIKEQCFVSVSAHWVFLVAKRWRWSEINKK